MSKYGPIHETYDYYTAFSPTYQDRVIIQKTSPGTKQNIICTVLNCNSGGTIFIDLSELTDFRLVTSNSEEISKQAFIDSILKL